MIYLNIFFRFYSKNLSIVIPKTIDILYKVSIEQPIARFLYYIQKKEVITTSSKNL